MTKEVFSAILQAAAGITLKEDAFSVGEDHLVAFHLGDPGRSTVVRHIRSGTVGPAFVAFTTAESEETYFFPYAALGAVSVRPSHKQGRAGFA